MLTATVRAFNGTPTLHLNGEPVNGIMQWHRWPEAEDVRNFARAGVNILSFMGNIWLGEEHERNKDASQEYHFNDGRMPCLTMDPERIQLVMDTLTRANPDLLVLPRIRLIPPDWWRERHPEEVIRHYLPDTREFAAGKWAAITSTLWREAALAALSETVRYFEAHWGDRVIGYHSGFGDCAEHAYYWGGISDYSRPQVEAFRRWLKAQYKHCEALREAWRDPAIDFHTADVPPPERRLRQANRDQVLYHPDSEQWVIDYQRFASEAMAESVVLQAVAVKAALRSLGRTKLFGAFYAYHNLPANVSHSHYNTGHDAHDLVLTCPDIDFICAPIGYSARQPGGVSTAQVLPGSIRLHDKLYYAEDDTGTHRVKRHHGYVLKSAGAAVQVARRNFLDIWSTGGTLWWMDLNGEGWFRDESVMAEFARLRAFADDHLANRTSLAQTAVFVSDRSMHYQRMDSVALSGVLVERQLNEICALGAGYDAYRIEDLPRLVEKVGLSRYRFCIFLDTLAVDDEIRTLVHRHLAAGNRTLLWCYAPGLIRNGEWDEGGASDLTGMDLRPLTSPGRAALAAETWLGGTRLVYGSERNLYPRLVGNDRRAELLGFYVEGENGATPDPDHDESPALMQRSFPTHRSIWSGVPGLPSSLLARFAEEAGVHLYCHGGHQVVAGPGWLGVHAKRSGPTEIRLPEPAAVTDWLTGERLGEVLTAFSVDLRRGETRLFEVAPRHEAQRE